MAHSMRTHLSLGYLPCGATLAFRKSAWYRLLLQSPVPSGGALGLVGMPSLPAPPSWFPALASDERGQLLLLALPHNGMSVRPEDLLEPRPKRVRDRFSWLMAVPPSISQPPKNYLELAVVICQYQKR